MKIRKDDYVALAAFRAALCRFLRFAEEGCKEAGLTPQQHQLMLAVRGHRNREWSSIGELADSLQLKHHATVVLVDRCQAAGLVERSHDTHDRRIVHVTLTEQGGEVLAKLTQRNLAELRAAGELTEQLEALTKR